MIGHLIGHATTGQLIMIPLATAGLAALGAAWAVDRVRDRRWQHRWDQALANCRHRSAPTADEPVDWEENRWA
jgi:hypothetical protein